MRDKMSVDSLAPVLELDKCSQWNLEHNHSFFNTGIPQHLEIEWLEACIGHQRWVWLQINTSWEQSSQFTDCFRRWLKLRRVLVEMTNTNNLQIHRMNPNFYMFGPVWTIYIYSPHFFFPNIKNHQRGNFHEEFYSQQYLHNLYEN